jgi:hypothetical protein
MSDMPNDHQELDDRPRTDDLGEHDPSIIRAMVEDDPDVAADVRGAADDSVGGELVDE